jgi:hypothetical protein
MTSVALLCLFVLHKMLFLFQFHDSSVGCCNVGVLFQKQTRIQLRGKVRRMFSGQRFESNIFYTDIILPTRVEPPSTKYLKQRFSNSCPRNVRKWSTNYVAGVRIQELQVSNLETTTVYYGQRFPVLLSSAWQMSRYSLKLVPDNCFQNFCN